MISFIITLYYIWQINEHAEPVLSTDTADLARAECSTTEEQVTTQSPVDLKKTQFLPAAEVSNKAFVVWYEEDFYTI